MDLTKSKVWFKKYGGVMIFLPVLILGWLYTRKKGKSLQEHVRYTIGVTKGEYKAYKEPLMVNYEYYVGGKKYKADEQPDFEVINNLKFFNNTMAKYIPDGGYYYVRFDSVNPNNSELLFGLPVPDSINKANFPLQGIKDIPYMRYKIGWFDNKVTISFRYRNHPFNFPSHIDTIQKRDFGKYCLISFSPLDPWVDAKYYPSNITDSLAENCPDEGWINNPLKH